MDKDTEIHTHQHHKRFLWLIYTRLFVRVRRSGLLEAGNQTGIRRRLEQTSSFCSKYSGHCEISELTHTHTYSETLGWHYLTASSQLKTMKTSELFLKQMGFVAANVQNIKYMSNVCTTFNERGRHIDVEPFTLKEPLCRLHQGKNNLSKNKRGTFSGRKG